MKLLARGKYMNVNMEVVGQYLHLNEATTIFLSKRESISVGFWVIWLISFFFRLQPLYLWYDLPIGKGVFIEPLLSRDCILSTAY